MEAKLYHLLEISILTLIDTPIRDAVKNNEPEISPQNALSVWNIGDYGFFFANDSYVKPNPKIKKVWSIKNKIIENQEYDPTETNKKLKIILKI